MRILKKFNMRMGHAVWPILLAFASLNCDLTDQTDLDDEDMSNQATLDNALSAPEIRANYITPGSSVLLEHPLPSYQPQQVTRLLVAKVNAAATVSITNLSAAICTVEPPLPPNPNWSPPENYEIVFVRNHKRGWCKVQVASTNLTSQTIDWFVSDVPDAEYVDMQVELGPNYTANLVGTGWLDRDDPGGSGDWESVSSHYAEGRIPCKDSISAVLGRRITDGVEASATGQNITLYSPAPNGGVVCKGSGCSDYAVQFYYQDNHACAEESLNKKYVASAWLNRDSPNGSGDWESFSGHKANIPCDKPVAMLARRVSDGVDFSQTGEVFESWRLADDQWENHGFVCKNSQQADGRCDDYEVKFYCEIDQDFEVVEVVGSCHIDWSSQDCQDYMQQCFADVEGLFLKEQVKNLANHLDNGSYNITGRQAAEDFAEVHILPYYESILGNEVKALSAGFENKGYTGIYGCVTDTQNTSYKHLCNIGHTDAWVGWRQSSNSSAAFMHMWLPLLDQWGIGSTLPRLAANLVGNSYSLATGSFDPTLRANWYQKTYPGMTEPVYTEIYENFHTGEPVLGYTMVITDEADLDGVPTSIKIGSALGLKYLEDTSCYKNQPPLTQ